MFTRWCWPTALASPKMRVGHLDSWEGYKFLKELPELNNLLRSPQTLSMLSTGEHKIGERGIRAIVIKYITKTREELKPESHDREYDLQIILKGSEEISYMPDEQGLGIDERLVGSDVISFRPDTKMKHRKLKPRMFALIPPGELHRPGGHPLGKPVRVHKVVIKIPRELIKG